jgi:hypothetical protein
LQPEFVIETVKFWWTPDNYVFSWMQIMQWTLMSWATVFLLYVFWMAGQCIVCNNKSMFLDRNDLCAVCKCLGAELPHPEIIARLKREKASRHNHSLNRLSCRDLKESISRAMGIHQLPPMTRRTALLLCRDGCLHLWSEAKAAGWVVVGFATCGAVRRFRKPKVLTLHQAAEVRAAVEEAARLQAIEDAGPSSAPVAVEGEGEGAPGGAAPGAPGAAAGKPRALGGSARVVPVEAGMELTDM